MFRIDLNRVAAIAATLVLMPVALVGTSANTASAAEQALFVSSWTGSGGGQWVPSTGSANAHGPSDSFCIAASSQPGGAEAFFSFPNFSIPAGDSIDGVEVIVDYETVGEQIIRLTDGGALTGTQMVLPANDGPNTCDGTSFESVGGATELWGTTFTPADFNNGDIGVYIKQKVITTSSGDPGSTTIDIDSVQLKVFHSGANTAPTAEANGDYSVPEGGSVSLSSAGSSDPDGDTLAIDWDLDNNGSFETPGASPSFSAAGFDGPDAQTVVVQVSDGSLSDTDTATVNITNVAPTIDTIIASAASIDEGDSVTVSGTFSDPGSGETYTGTSLWSDGVITAVTIGDGTFSTERTFPDDHPTTTTPSDQFTVQVTIDDGDGGQTSAVSPIVTVNNVEPSIDAIGVSAASIDEGDSVTVSGTFVDPALGEVTETFSGSAAWSDGASTAVVVGAGTFSTERTFLDDDPFTATPSDNFTVDVTINDDDLGSGVATSPVLTVNNVAPVITSIDSSATFADKAEEGETVTVSGAFTDVGTLDTHTAVIDWGDGDIEPATVVQAVGGGTYTADHTYLAGGVFTVTVTITDDDTGAASDSTLAVVTGVGINGGVLQIVGTAGADHVDVKAIRDEIDVFADFVSPKHRRFDLAAVTSVEVWLCEGDDHGSVHQSIDLPTIIHGGDDDDMLWGGSGPDVINGGDGDDQLWGRGGDDELYGGDGDDVLRGGTGSDLLDGGSGNNKVRD